MNYLAHIFLSGTKTKQQIGNFIGDAVKGKSYKNYHSSIAYGILQHRAIDNYTDHHPLIIETIAKLRPEFSRYSGVLLDIWFDHLLASHFYIFSKISLKNYARRFYIALALHRYCLPIQIKGFMWHFIFTDRLGNYANLDGIKDTLEKMVQYRNVNISVEKAMQYLTDNKNELLAVFFPFFQELQSYCKNYLSTENQ